MLKENSNKNPVTQGQFNRFQQDVCCNFNGVRSSIKEIKKILIQHTTALLSIENTMKFYGDMYKINKEGIERLDHRVTVLESL